MLLIELIFLLKFMKIIHIELPDKFQFFTTIKVRITDINYGGHLGNDATLSILHEARLQYLQKLGFKNEGEGPNGVGIIVTDVAIVYKQECFYGANLKIEISAQEVSRRRCNLYYKISDLDKETETARAQTGILFFDHQSRKLTTIPKQLYLKLSTEVLL